MLAQCVCVWVCISIKCLHSAIITPDCPVQAYWVSLSLCGAAGGKCHSYEWRTSAWNDNERSVWCQRSDGVNVTGIPPLTLRLREWQIFCTDFTYRKIIKRIVDSTWQKICRQWKSCHYLPGLMSCQTYVLLFFTVEQKGAFLNLDLHTCNVHSDQRLSNSKKESKITIKVLVHCIPCLLKACECLMWLTDPSLNWHRL